VLGRFRPEEREVMMAAVLRAADASEMFLSDGIERVMNAFNADAAGAGNRPASARTEGEASYGEVSPKRPDGREGGEPGSGK
jgi:hypothetical protein